MNLTGLTREILAAQRPDLMQEIEGAAREAGKAEGHAAGVEEGRKSGEEAGKAEGVKAGAEAERQRIAAIDEHLVPGCEKLAAECKANGATAEAFCVKQAAFLKGQGSAALEALKGDEAALAGASGEDTALPSAGASASGAPAAPPADPSDPETAKAADEKLWAKSADLRAEFRDKTTFLAYRKAEREGRIRRPAPRPAA